jgi:hypothetical protein
MRAPVDDLRYPGAPGKLRKQAIASIGAVQPTIISEWLNLHDYILYIERFDEDPRGESRQSFNI